MGVRKWNHLGFGLVLVLLVGLLLSGELSAAGRRYALVVGVETYRPNQPLPKLSYTESDADALAAVLTKGGYQVTLMTQSVGRQKGKEVYNPLSDYIRDQLSAMLGNPFLREEDVVIVALAGHGVQFEEVKNGQKSPRFYFCPADADIRQVKSANEIEDRNRLLDLDELYNQLDECKAGGKLLLVDACRNDPSKPTGLRSPDSITLPPLPPPPGGTAAFFSCSKHQRAYEDPTLKHGVFFHYVIEALGGAADTSTRSRQADRQITLAELNLHVSPSVYDFVRKKYGGARQAPELKGAFRVTIPLIELPDEKLIGQKAGETRTDNGLNMSLVWCPPGTFTMGSPKEEEWHSDDEDQVQVTLTNGFWLGQTEVTQGQWEALMGSTPWKGRDDVKEGSNYPATYVRWEDAMAFCKELTKQEREAERLPDDWEYTLPTEAQWEYACRAGTTTAYSFGDDESKLGDYAWFVDNAFDVNEQYAHLVSTKKPNPWNLSDMHGNVCEWCRDWHADKLPGGRDPEVTAEGSNRVSRNGGWRYLSWISRSASRSREAPSSRYHALGFRVARVLSSQ